MSDLVFSLFEICAVFI